MKEAFDHADDREDEDDLHLCLRCQSTIRGLDNYIRHRRTRDSCFRSEVKKVDLVDQRDCSTPLGGQSASPSPSHPESPLLLSLGLQQKAHQQHQEGNEPGTVRSRRPSSDEAAAFMETLGLKSSSSSSKPQQQQQQQQQHTLTNLFFQEQLPSFFSSCWEEHHQLFPSSSSDVQQLLSSSSSLQLLQKPNPHSLLSFDKPHHKQHHLASKLIEASGSNKSFLSPSLQNDFMRQIDLVNVSHHGLEAEEGEVNPDPAPSSAPSLTPLTSTPTTVASSSCPQQEQQQQQEQPQPQPNPGGRWRLWIPEQEGCPEEGGEDALLLEDVLLSGLDSSCCYDPTLIEVASAVQEAQHQRHVVDDSSQQVHEEEVTNSKVTASASDVSPTKEKPVQQECQDLEALSSKYRCHPCDRTLASRELYEKHLLSELHFKRASSASSSISTGTGMKKNPYLLLERGKSVTNPSTGTIRLRKKNKRYSSSSSETESCRPSLAKQPTAPKTDAGIINCESCSAPVNAWQYGKHLISHYHHHRSKLPKNHPTSVRLVLRHIEDIVRLAPFQCSVCQFYANWPHELLAHWESEFHLEHDQNNAVDNIKDDSANTYYWCSFCACLSSSSERMGDHLRGSKHAEIVDAISRHVPITIKKVRLHPCHLCDKQFRLRFSLKKHVRQAHKVRKTFFIIILSIFTQISRKM